MKSKVQRKWSVQLFILVVIFATLVAFLVSLLEKIEPKERGIDFPAGNLSKEIGADVSYAFPDELNNTYNCPSLPYEISFPGEVNIIGKFLYSEYEDIRIAIYESDVEDKSGLEMGLLSLTSVNSVDIPDIAWEEHLSERGYVNNVPTIYKAGIANAVFRFSREEICVLSYQMLLEEDNSLFVVLATTEDDLNKAKSVLDFVSKSVHSNAVEAGKADVEETEENPVEESLYIEDFEIYQREELGEMYLVVSWENADVEPQEFYLICPDERIVNMQDIAGANNEKVFYLNDMIKGTYFIHIESSEMLRGIACEIVNKEDYQNFYE